jgi:uncharacterized protein YdaU (DUF1376 family)
MQLYVSDFVGDTMHLSTEQTGAYLLLLMAMWNADGTLPNEPAKLARVAKVPLDTWPSVWADLAPYFDIEDGKVGHGRLALELAKFARKSEARREAGSRGGKAKALKDKQPHLAIASGLPQHLPETRIKKARAIALDPTESVERVSKLIEPEVFAACLEATGEKDHGFLEAKSFPIEIVGAARQRFTGTAH